MLLSTTNLNLLKTGKSRKLLPRFVGPFTITDTIGKAAYRLELPSGWKIHDVFHVSLLRKFDHDGRFQPLPPPELTDDDTVEYEVEKILDHRQKKIRTAKKAVNKTEYLIRWAGYGPEHDSWEPEENLTNCKEKLNEYLNKLNH